MRPGMKHVALLLFAVMLVLPAAAFAQDEGTEEENKG